MGISLLYGCAQVELTVGNLAVTRDFICGVLGGEAIEQELAREITALFPNGDFHVEHFDCGQGLFQYNEPSSTADYAGQTSVHHDYLVEQGPCVTNLNFFIDDARHAHELLTARGATTLIEGPSSAARCLADYGPENTRPGGDERKFYFMGTRPLIGLDFEMMEPNFNRFCAQDVQYPCFVQPRPATGDGLLHMLRLRLVVPDIEAAHANIVALFAPGSRSKPYAYRESMEERAFRIGLGGIELEYCQPISSSGRMARALDRFGPGVESIAFACKDSGRILDRLPAPRRASVEEVPGGWIIASRDAVGFDVMLEAADPRPFVGNWPI